MKKEPLFIAFSTQQGGAGKTTLTVLMASYLYYVKGYDVAVVDCDYPQFSIKDMRERDLKSIERNPYLRKLAYEQFKRIGKRAYPIVGSRPGNAIETVRPFVESATPPDFIFFDLTGTVNNLDLIRTVATMDYIFCPIAADRFIMESSLKYASVINDTLITTGKSNIKGIRLLWNMVDKREKTDLYDIYDKVIAGMGLEVLNTSLPDSKRFRKEGSEEGDRPFFRSTLLPPDKALAKGPRPPPLKVAERMATLPQRRPGWRRSRRQRRARMPRKRKRNTWNASSMHRKSPCVRARPPTSARATTSGYSVSCRSSGRTGLRCRSMWTVCWSSTSANTRK